VIYIIYIFINQQQVLNSYKNTQNYYVEQITIKQAYKETLYASKASIDSKEYIESVAREKLEMYLPNERVYINNGK
jgi:hypothetical protein